MKVGIIGGGIIGLCSAWYLVNEGFEVEIFERGDGSDGCSFGNMGYLSPSHFIPLASPGMVWQGIKYMMDATSPFYIQPRADLDLVRWAFRFWQSATEAKVKVNSPALNELLQFSRLKTIEMSKQLGSDIDLQLKGCYMMYRLPKTADHEQHLAEKARAFGIDTQILNAAELQAAEPNLGVNALGAVLYPLDGHLHPGKWIHALRAALTAKGAIIHYNTEIEELRTTGNTINTAIDAKGEEFAMDHWVIATGAWLPLLMKKLGLRLLMQAGKGYSTTFSQLPHNLSRPAILVDDRVALTPFGTDLRVGGTMELSGINHTIRTPRVQAILNAVKRNFSFFDFSLPPTDKLWCGLRPVTPDGLPYLGNSPNFTNLTISAGHAMLGVSLAAGTGHMVMELVKGCNTTINLSAFSVNRY